MGLLEPLQYMQVGQYLAGFLSPLNSLNKAWGQEELVCYLFIHCLLRITSPSIGHIPVTEPLSSLIAE